MIKIAGNGNAAPLELRLDHGQLNKAQGITKLVLMCASVLKWSWWHTTSYLPIVAVLVLALGSLLVLQAHWLYRRLVSLPAREPGREKEIINDAS